MWDTWGGYFKLMKTIIFIYQLIKFIFISVPLGLLIYLTASTYFEVKRLLYKNKL